VNGVNDPAQLGYEQARDELLDVVRRLESGNVPLEESLALWERGEALAARCEEWLDGARARVEGAVERRRKGAEPSAAD
jgi:exodeoxyribonuclease VII small subunit